MRTLAQVNAMPPDAFMSAFGDVAEHSPWVAKAALRARPFTDREAMIGAFELALQNATHGEQLALIRAHPDLATRARLTADSSREQAGAGLDTLTPEEFHRFTTLNEAYKSRFGFPFIFAVKGAGKHQILESFAERVNNSPDDEFAMALRQIARIFRFRIEDRISA
ncbi:2-oxo-4-hydroxy-4-carboxy-5-ureidoimidazoline decarboxylase [Aestuariivirga sp.]|uniref:2-oxo-4-hydroxy-4-carboxy-5-ureidoimidazoline decarboxylase n=1 Tax=Aestuariivirga sp. TaxID=2650926 RepID=UPI0039E446EC